MIHFFNLGEFFEEFDNSFNRDGVNPEDFFKSKKFNKIEEKGEDKDHNWSSEKWVSEDGSTSYYRKTTISKGFTPKEPSKKELEAHLQRAIEEDRFEDAAVLRDKIKTLKS